MAPSLSFSLLSLLLSRYPHLRSFHPFAFRNKSYQRASTRPSCIQGMDTNPEDFDPLGIQSRISIRPLESNGGLRSSDLEGIFPTWRNWRENANSFTRYRITFQYVYWFISLNRSSGNVTGKSTRRRKLQASRYECVEAACVGWYLASCVEKFTLPRGIERSRSIYRSVESLRENTRNEDRGQPSVEGDEEKRRGRGTR